MIYQAFVHIVNMGITASVVMLAVFIARGFLRKVPRRYAYFLWLIVGIRLICPVGIPSDVSVFNLVGQSEISLPEYRKNSVPEKQRSLSDSGSEQQSIGSESAVSGSGIDASKKISGEGNLSEQNLSESGNKSSRTVESGAMIQGTGEKQMLHPFVRYGALVWAGVGSLLLVWNVFLMHRMKMKVAKAVRLQDNIYECDNIPSPFVMGFIRPRIFIPFRLGEREQEYIICHERHHIKRKDNMIKCAAFLLTCVYWFHPLVWFSYFLMIRDMEMSCDEYVIQKYAGKRDEMWQVCDIREEYSKSLLGFAMNRRNINMGAGLIAFGESDTRRRVKHIMKFKTYGKWIGMVAVAMILVVGTACLTDARDSRENSPKKEKTSSGKSEGGKAEAQYDYKIVATSEIQGYRVELQCVSADKIETNEEMGYSQGDALVIQTSRENDILDRYEVKPFINGVEKMYFPSEGFELHVEDYDGDGLDNDFALGQGQMPSPNLGNFMSYRFFGIDESGKVIGYGTSSDDGFAITTVPGEYSPVFERKNGELLFEGLGEDGVEKMSVSIVRCISTDEIEETKQEPEYTIMKYVNTNMPCEVVEELQEKGVWHVIRGEENQMQYNLANGENAENITLRLDFSYEGNRLVKYTSKEYGFTDAVKKSEGGDFYLKLVHFAGELGDSPSKYVDEYIDDVLRDKEYEGNVIGLAELPERWKDQNLSYFKDTDGASYLFDDRINMVVQYEREN